MKLYVLRHGETEGNVAGVMSGHQEVFLTEKGKEEARKVRDILPEKKIDLIIASPLKRTVQTAEIVSDGKIPIIYDDRLKSRNHGEFAGMKRTDVNLKEYWDYNLNKQYKEAESVRDLYNRAREMIYYVKEKYPDKTVLLVTHSGVCRAIYHYFNGIRTDGDMLSDYEAVTGLLEEYDM